MSNPYEKVSEIGDSISGAISTIASHKEFVGKQVINFILLFIILLVFGCLDWMDLKFHPEYLLMVDYWAKVLTKTIAGVCSFNIGINLLWDTEIKKDTILADNIKLYKRLYKYKQNDFDYFVVHIYNPREKTKAYESQINKQIYWLNKFSRRRDRLLYSKVIPEDAENREQLLKELEQQRLNNKYCVHRQELEDLKKPDFIKRNLDSLKVKYYEVDPATFELEVDGSATVRGVRTVGNVTLGKVKASANVVLGMVGLSMFITALGLEFNSEEFVDQMQRFWVWALKCATDVGIILWQTFRGMLNARKIISAQLTNPYVGRNKVLTEYLEWRLATNQPSSLAYIELHKDDNVEEVEMTQEEFDKIKKERENQ